MCSFRIIGLAVLGVFLFLTPLGLLIYTTLSEMAKTAENDIASVLSQYGAQSSNFRGSAMRVDGVQSISSNEINDNGIDCDCFNINRALNNSKERMLNLYDFDYENSVIFVKYKPEHGHNKVDLVWDLHKFQIDDRQGLFFGLTTATWNRKSCYIPSSIRIIEKIRRKENKHRLLSGPYKLYIEDRYKLKCENCFLGYVESQC
jgi:hypothetical protein